MNNIILHHYELSPFSEKVRRILAYRGIPWSAVEQPIMAPKPELTPLTGGYRRIPVMQIGADVYCDTALIVRRLEELHPQRSVIPQSLAGAAALLEDWADHRLFMNVVPPTLIDLFDSLPPGFLEDRAAMTSGFSREAIIEAAPHALAQTRHALDNLDAQLTVTDFLLGENFTIADAACFHPVRFLMNSSRLVVEIDQRLALAKWVKRIQDFGAGEVESLNADEALAVARNAQPEDIGGDSIAIEDYALGDTVTISADDYGTETTIGKLVRIRPNQITVVRRDADVGDVAVHYPRAGYRVSKES